MEWSGARLICSELAVRLAESPQPLWPRWQCEGRLQALIEQGPAMQFWGQAAAEGDTMSNSCFFPADCHYRSCRGNVQSDRVVHASDGIARVPRHATAQKAAALGSSTCRSSADTRTGSSYSSVQTH